MHQPLDDLAESDRAVCAPLLGDYLDLVLRGHLYGESLETMVTPDRATRHFAAGCLYEGGRHDQWPNACHVLDVNVAPTGRPRRYDLRLRAYSPRGHWPDDNSLYPGTRDGRFSGVDGAPLSAR